MSILVPVPRIKDMSGYRQLTPQEIEALREDMRQSSEWSAIAPLSATRVLLTGQGGYKSAIRVLSRPKPLTLLGLLGLRLCCVRHRVEFPLHRCRIAADLTR